MRIIILEDEIQIANILKFGLEKEGFAVDCFYDGQSGQEHLEMIHESYDLLILDVMLPKRNGFEVCQNLRQQKINIPILMLTARDALSDKVQGLNYGADDYLVKPFAFEELLARIRTVLRRPKTILPNNLTTADLILIPQTRQAFRSKQELNLTTKEFELLEYFLRHKGQVLSREQIIDHTWDDKFDSFSNIVDAHIKNLRKKVDEGRQEKLFETIRGVGYRLRKIDSEIIDQREGGNETLQFVD